MPKSLKNIVVIFLFCQMLSFHQHAFAWRAQDTTSQSSKYVDAEDSVVEFNDDPFVKQTDEAATPAEAAEDYNELNFDPVTAPPAQAKRSLNEAEWSKYQKDPDYQYEEIKEKKQQPVDYSKSWWVRTLMAIFQFFGSTYGKLLVVVLVAAFVIFIVVRVLMQNGNIFFSKKDKKIAGDNDEHADDYVPENWDNEIAAAAKAGNYRLALRHCYRYLLTSLAEKELIQFQVAKTNYQYVYELAGTGYHKPFMKLTRDYEYAWYGGFEINEDFFKIYYQTAQDIQKQLNR